jgi:hypothetical protein
MAFQSISFYSKLDCINGSVHYKQQKTVKRLINLFTAFHHHSR